jgi:hypothetical protein
MTEGDEQALSARIELAVGTWRATEQHRSRLCCCLDWWPTSASRPGIDTGVMAAIDEVDLAGNPDYRLTDIVQGQGSPVRMV